MRETSWEFTGKNVEEAEKIALDELGLDRDDIHVEVLEEPQKGFLGIGGKEARIRVELIGEWEVLGKKEDRIDEIEEIEEKEEIRPEDNTKKPLRMVKDILKIFHIDAMVEAKERQDAVVIDVWGEDVALLIGKGGATLDALQYLINVSCRRTGEVKKRIIVDIEGYRKRRKARLEKRVQQLARKVISEGKSMEMEPMTPSERKIVHMEIGNINGVWSESTGDGRDRRVVIRLND